jgi:hypothetical protein
MIRPTDASDLPQIAALYHAVWHETQAPFMPEAERNHRTMEFFMDRMAALLQTTLVEERDGEIVAFVAWRSRLLGQLYVVAPDRGTRVASSLLTAAEVEMAREGTAEVELHYAASRRVISASAAIPSAVNEYGELCALVLFFTKRLRLRYCMRAFIDWGGRLNAFVTSLIRNSPESKINESTLRIRSDSTGMRSAWACRADCVH